MDQPAHSAEPQRGLHGRSMLLMIAAVIAAPASTFFASRRGIPSSFRLWELQFSLPALVLAAFSLPIALETGRRAAVRQAITWKLRAPAAATHFVAPVFFALGAAGLGVLLHQARFTSIENPGTLILALLLDIPAALFFSATTILVEEFFFRGVLITSARDSRISGKSLLGGTFAWIMYSTIALFDPSGHHVISPEDFAFLVSTGLACLALRVRFGSIWEGYLFRVGLSVILPTVLSIPGIECDSFFESRSLWFHGNGVAMDALLLLMAGGLLLSSRKRSGNGPDLAPIGQ